MGKTPCQAERNTIIKTSKQKAIHGADAGDLCTEYVARHRFTLQPTVHLGKGYNKRGKQPYGFLDRNQGLEAGARIKGG